MRKYARIEGGRVYEFFSIEDGENIYTYFPAELVWVDVTDIPEIGEGWAAYKNSDGTWSISPYIPPPPTEAEILSAQILKLRQCSQIALRQKVALSNRISTLMDAVELEMATPEEMAELSERQLQLIEWKRYAIFLGRVTQQEGWYQTVDWPIEPTEGMDLAVSAVESDSAQP